MSLTNKFIHLAHIKPGGRKTRLNKGYPARSREPHIAEHSAACHPHATVHSRGGCKSPFTAAHPLTTVHGVACHGTQLRALPVTSYSMHRPHMSPYRRASHTLKSVGSAARVSPLTAVQADHNRVGDAQAAQYCLQERNRRATGCGSAGRPDHGRDERRSLRAGA